MSSSVTAIVQQYVGPLVNSNGTPSSSQAPGGIAAVYLGGESYYVPFGYINSAGDAPTPDTVFGLGSVTKTLTTSILGQSTNLFNAAVDDYLPPGFTLLTSEQAVTFEELATFTGGIPEQNPPQETQAAFQAFIANVAPPVLPAPNVYSDCSIGLLGQVLMYNCPAEYKWIDAATNAADATTWYQDFLLTALGMTSTTATPPGTSLATPYQYDSTTGAYETANYEPWCPWGTAGRMYSSASDMVDFIMANVGITIINGNSVPQDILDGMAQALMPRASMQPPKNDVQQAFAWQVFLPTGSQEGNICGKLGGVVGVSSYVAVNPTLQYGAVILLNMWMPGVVQPVAIQMMQALQPIATAMRGPK